MSSKEELIPYILFIFAAGAIAIGVSLSFSAWYVGYLAGIPLGTYVLVVGIVLLIIWLYLVKFKQKS